MVAELKEMEISGVHLVGSPAIQKRYLIVKSEEGGGMADNTDVKDDEKDKKDVNKACAHDSMSGGKCSDCGADVKKAEDKKDDVKKDDVKVDDAKVDDKASGSGEKDEELIKGVMAILKSANSEGAKAALASLESQFGEKKVEKTEVANVIKSMVPDIAKQIEEPLRKSLDETKAELEDIRKSNAMLIGEKVEREIEEISKSLVGDSTENKEYLRLMKAKCSPEEFDKVVKREKARSETIRKAGTFRETGSSGYGTSSGGSAYQQLSEIANGYIQKSGNEKLTFNDAFAKAVAEREDLWDEYRNSAYANRSRED